MIEFKIIKLNFFLRITLIECFRKNGLQYLSFKIFNIMFHNQMENKVYDM